jgi:putative flippase GtrA
LILKTFFNFQFINFVGVGISAAIIHWLIRIIANFYYDFITSVVISYFVTLCYAFIVNFIFVFKNKISKLSKISKYILVNIFFFPIVYFSSIELNSFFINFNLSYHAEVAHGISISIPALISFIIYKYIIFIDYEKK